MSFRNILIICAIAGAIFIWRATHDPLKTRLPVGSADLSQVQGALDQLPSDERALVEAYVQRSQGQYMPQDIAATDFEFTARTFGEAIKLQKQWQSEQKNQQVQTAERKADREASFDPLRAVVSASLIKAEVLTRDEFLAREDAGNMQGGSFAPVIEEQTPEKKVVFLTHVRVQNLSSGTITRVRGSLNAVQGNRRGAPRVSLCDIRIDEDRPLTGGAYLDISCGESSQVASEHEQEFAKHPGSFQVVWEPSKVSFSSGQELKSDS